MDRELLQRKKNMQPPQGVASAAPAQLSGGGIPNSAMAEALGGNYQSNMSGLEANMNQRMQAVQQSVPPGTIQMVPKFPLSDGAENIETSLGEFTSPDIEDYSSPEVLPAQAPSFWRHPIEYFRYKRKLKQQKKYEKSIRNHKRAWQMDDSDFANNQFNPGDRDEIAAIQKKIDKAKTPEAAFKALAGRRAAFSAESPAALAQLDNAQFKRRLKNMARMVADYPELKDLLTEMFIRENDPNSKAAMSAVMKKDKNDHGRLIGGKVNYMAENGEKYAFEPKDFTNENLDYTGNHELGHLLNGHLIGLKQQDRGSGYRQSSYDWNHMETADAMLKKVVRKQFAPAEQAGFKTRSGQPVDLRPKKQRLGANYAAQRDDHYDLNNQFGMNESGFSTDFTARYGRTNAAEFFAEAFADVYNHGKKAKPASIRLVREYERRRDKLTRRIESRGQKAGMQK